MNCVDVAELDDSAPILQLPGLPPPSVRPAPFDADAAIDAIRIAAARLGGLLVTLHAELERIPLPDADLDRDPGSVGRVAILDHALTAAETSATRLCLELSTPDPDRSVVRRAQIEVGGAEAFLVLLGRELGRAPWDASDGRISLLSELVQSAQDAARRVRSGLGAVADQLTVGA